MLLTKILVALQILHHYVILGHPLALSKVLVKRAEGTPPGPIEILRGMEEAAERRTVYNTLINPPQVPHHKFTLCGDPIFRDDYVSVHHHLDQKESKLLQNIVKNDPAGNPFVHMNTLRAILDDTKKREVLEFAQKYPIVPDQSSAFDLKRSHLSGYSYYDELICE
ncbi:hypothetical protein MJO28_012008 [Puccinia striiformis f. sp. tritici]|uniref:Uncharacterized protein n=1 Tax=Puccinia striiformis f. sp. tritici TaxID=168172 RepID=A0ACC0DZX7_9BASI|nr:hypothetical protein MJO28_012008 [Puccinia striiformis f. sp. tritici]